MFSTCDWKSLGPMLAKAEGMPVPLEAWDDVKSEQERPSNLMFRKSSKVPLWKCLDVFDLCAGKKGRAGPHLPMKPSDSSAHPEENVIGLSFLARTCRPAFCSVQD